jgi:hypothetical protein
MFIIMRPSGCKYVVLVHNFFLFPIEHIVLCEHYPFSPFVALSGVTVHSLEMGKQTQDHLKINVI